ncbi:MAG: YdeI/OmpD-associated family protein [Candidatus Pacebacteria bacterium]|nr:YdeI/OmpD-associated family protein [Candidatus Paceibacterota bacterium]
MDTPIVATGVVHKVPKDLREVLLATPKVLELWNALTPLARNEWICYVTIVKKAETRREHIHRLQEELLKGKKRPCCWPGCPHRRPNAAKWFHEQKTKS